MLPATSLSGFSTGASKRGLRYVTDVWQYYVRHQEKAEDKCMLIQKSKMWLRLATNDIIQQGELW